MNKPINAFGNSSDKFENKIDTSLFVQKFYLKTDYTESKTEWDSDLKNQFRSKNSPDSIRIREAVSKKYIDNLFNDRSIMKIDKDVDFKDVKLENKKTGKLNYQPAVNEHLIPKIWVDDAIDENTLVRSNRDIDFNNFNLTHINSITLNTQALNDNQVISEA